MKAPLEGIKILDFSHLLPGPFATMMLADLGADVIKVENKNTPDLMRLVPPMVDNISAAYAHINRGKKSLAIDLKSETARGIIRRLVGNYDIVFEQFRPGVMERLGLGYKHLQEVNQSIIYCSLTGYGQTGSYSERAGHDINYLALSGIESYSGREAHGPALSGIQIADIAGGSKNAVIALLAAYLNRLRTGKGEHVDVSITEGVFSMALFSAAGFLADGVEPKTGGEALNGGSVYDFYRTSDNRYLSVGPIEPKFLEAFGKGIGFPDMVKEFLASPGSLCDIKKRITTIIGSQPLTYWCERFAHIDACVEPVRTINEAVSSPPISERDMMVTVSTSSGATVQQIASPFRFGSCRYSATSAGVPLGFHTEEILRDIGYSKNEINTFKADGVV